MILPEIKELKYISMPWFQVNSEGAFAFATALVYITGRIIKYTQHRYNAIAGAVCSFDITTGRADIMNIQTNTACRLGNERRIFQRFIDTFNAVIFHTQQET